MSALAKIKPISSTVSTLEMVLDWMDESFDGNLPQAATLAAEKAQKARLISGPLWDEIGEQVLSQLYRLRRIHTQRRTAIKAQPKEEKADPSPDVYSVWHYVGGRYYFFGDMTKQDCQEVAAYYDSLSRANGLERDFLLQIADGLNDKQMVRDRYTPEEILKMREGLAGEPQQA